MGLLRDFIEFRNALKNQAQPGILSDQGSDHSGSDNDRRRYERSYSRIEVIRRGTDMIVDSAAEVDISITDQLPFSVAHKGRKIKANILSILLNHYPNAAEDISTYRRLLYMDLILSGNCFQYYEYTGEGKGFLYHLPAYLVKVIAGDDEKVSHYIYNVDGEEKRFEVEEIIHTKDNNERDIYVGRSRLYPTRRTIAIMEEMLDFQQSFFENGAVPGLVIQTPNILGTKIKERLLADWKKFYKPNAGGRSPLLLDGDMKVNPLSQTKFSELDFAESVDSHEIKILKALGVPPILLNSGNNANLRPNIQLFYEMTVLPLTDKLVSSYERFFAYDMKAETTKVRALRPELRDAAAYFTALVNTGVMTPNEARVELRLEPSTESHADKLRIPANIAGSASDPSEGGRPPADDEPKE